MLMNVICQLTVARELKSYIFEMIPTRIGN